MSTGLLGRLPAALRGRRDVLDDRERWSSADVAASAHAAVLVRAEAGGTLVWALGEPADLATMLRDVLVAHGPGVRWLTAPRDVDVASDALAAAGVVRRTSWDRLTLDHVPPAAPGEDLVVALDGDRDGAAVGACLDAANPTTHARPGAADDAAWCGVRDDADGLRGVVGVAWRAGPAPDGPRTVHLHGLGVTPAARGRGLGAALTTAAARHALTAGAPWVGLGMYADNHAARRVYARVGFRVDERNAGYGPPGAARP